MFGRLFAFLSLVLPFAVRCATVPDVIIDHDGGVDDLVAIALLMRSGNVQVRAVTVCPADSYLDPATRATQLFLERLGGRNIPVAQGHTEGVNPFPARWRRDAGRVLGIPALAGKTAAVNPITTEDAAHYLVKLLSGSRAYTILETGPLTNVADALRIDPSIKRNIRRVFVMGGAVRVRGNVEQKGHDGSAEWNIYNQPDAAAEVVRSGIPITLVPLDATNNTPLTEEFVKRLSARPAMAAQLAAQSLSLVVSHDGPDRYYFWDTLTAAALVDPSVIRTEQLRIRVITTGESQGRTVEDPRGTAIDVAVDADRERVEQMFLKILSR